jgi:hypothetical protein
VKVIGWVVSLALITVQGAAQDHSLRLTAGVSALAAREGFHDSKEHGNGTLIGGEASVRVGRIGVVASGLVGKLSSDSVGAGERTVRITKVSLQVHPTRWLAVGTRFHTERRKEGEELTYWRGFGTFGAIMLGLGIDGLSTRVDGAWYPTERASSTSPYGPRLRNGSSLEIGLDYGPTKHRTSVRLAYLVEVHTFDTIESIPMHGSIRRGGVFFGLAMRLRGTS